MVNIRLMAISCASLLIIINFLITSNWCLSSDKNLTNNDRLDNKTKCILDMEPKEPVEEWHESKIIGGFRVWQVLFLGFVAFIALLVIMCCLFRCRIPRTKQEIEADIVRKKITTAFQTHLSKIAIEDLEAQPDSILPVLQKVELMEESRLSKEGEYEDTKPTWKQKLRAIFALERETSKGSSIEEEIIGANVDEKDGEMAELARIAEEERKAMEEKRMKEVSATVDNAKIDSTAFNVISDHISILMGFETEKDRNKREIREKKEREKELRLEKKQKELMEKLEKKEKERADKAERKQRELEIKLLKKAKQKTTEKVQLSQDNVDNEELITNDKDLERKEMEIEMILESNKHQDEEEAEINQWSDKVLNDINGGLSDKNINGSDIKENNIRKVSFEDAMRCAPKEVDEDLGEEVAVFIEEDNRVIEIEDEKSKEKKKKSKLKEEKKSNKEKEKNNKTKDSEKLKLNNKDNTKEDIKSPTIIGVKFNGSKDKEIIAQTEEKVEKKSKEKHEKSGKEKVDKSRKGEEKKSKEKKDETIDENTKSVKDTKEKLTKERKEVSKEEKELKSKEKEKKRQKEKSKEKSKESEVKVSKEKVEKKKSSEKEEKRKKSGEDDSMKVEEKLDVTPQT